MVTEPSRQPAFQITHEEDPGEILIAGFSTTGLAGLTSVDYLVNQLDLQQIGVITTEELPPITPFENGVPRHHTRLYSRSDFEFSVLVNELFVPVWAAESFANDILAWTDANEIREICILAGIPVPHGPDDHKVFFVATEDYREHRLDGVGLPAMGNGFLDGVNSSLVVRGMDTPLQTGVLVTPVHPQAPDIEASIRLVDALKNVYEIDIDTSELEGFAAEIQRYYRELGERIKSVNQEEIPEDRMYM